MTYFAMIRFDLWCMIINLVDFIQGLERIPIYIHVAFMLLKIFFPVLCFVDHCLSFVLSVLT